MKGLFTLNRHYKFIDIDHREPIYDSHGSLDTIIEGCQLITRKIGCSRVTPLGDIFPWNDLDDPSLNIGLQNI